MIHDEEGERTGALEVDREATSTPGRTPPHPASSHDGDSGGGLGDSGWGYSAPGWAIGLDW